MLDRVSQQRRATFAPVIALAFSANQEADCLDFLKQRSANTEIITISDEMQLRLAADACLIETGYRFNILGFTAVAGAICPGLPRVFGDISGLIVAKYNNLDDCNVPAAVAIYNTALRVKFEQLREKTLLVDHAARAIDGLYGLNHKILDNAIFFEAVLIAMREHAPDCYFYRAEIIGRALSIYIIDPRSRRTNVARSGDVYSAGWYFSNREDSGNSAKAVPCLYTPYGVALSPTGRTGRVIHVGADIMGRVGELIHSAYAKIVDMDMLAARMKILEAQPLGISDKSEFNAIVKKWVGYLARFGLAHDDAKHIVKNAIQVGKDTEPRDPLDVFTGRSLTSRTALDLVCAILRYARTAHLMSRHKIQTTGMQMLLPTPTNKERR